MTNVISVMEKKRPKQKRVKNSRARNGKMTI